MSIDRDGIGISPNAARIIKQWGDGAVNERLKEFVSDLTRVHTWHPSGKYI